MTLNHMFLTMKNVLFLFTNKIENNHNNTVKNSQQAEQANFSSHLKICASDVTPLPRQHRKKKYSWLNHQDGNQKHFWFCPVMISSLVLLLEYFTVISPKQKSEWRLDLHIVPKCRSVVGSWMCVCVSLQIAWGGELGSSRRTEAEDWTAAERPTESPRREYCNTSA